MFKKYFEISTQKERDLQLSHGQLGLEKHKEYLHPKPIIDRERVPNFLITELESSGFLPQDDGEILYMDKLKSIIDREINGRIKKADKKINIKESRILVIPNKGVCYYTSDLDDYVHGDVANYAMACGDVELDRKNRYFMFTDNVNVAKNIVGFEIDYGEMYFSESYSGNVFKWLMKEEQKTLIDKCHSLLRQYFIFGNLYLTRIHDYYEKEDVKNKIYVP